MVVLADLLGPTLQSTDGDVEIAEAFPDASAVGLYFADQSDGSVGFTEELIAAYNDSLKEKGLEVVLVVSPDSVGIFESMPWLLYPANGGLGTDALVAQFEAHQLPRLVILDMEGEVNTLDGVDRVRADAAGESFPWKEDAPPALTEDDILTKLGNCSPAAGQPDLLGIFISRQNFVSLGFIDSEVEDDSKPFTGPLQRRPYREVSKQAVTQEIQHKGFASDFHVARNEIERYTGENLLIFFDPEETYNQKFVIPTTKESYEREIARIQELRDDIVQQFEDSLRAPAAVEGTVVGQDPDADIVVRDMPRPCGEWISESATETHGEVANFTVHNSRPLMALMITRPRINFGRPYKFSDSTDNADYNCRPHKDQNYAWQKRELERGIQAVKEMKTSWCQTIWFRPVNKATQYSPSDFLKEDKDLDNAKVEALSVFLQGVSVGVEEALQTNETVDIFREEFAHLGDEEAGAISKTASNIREFRNFQDVNFTKNKRIEWVEWVPHSVDMIAASYIENAPFSQRVDTAGKATISHIMLWSFQDFRQPHAALNSPWEVSVFKFWPTDGRFLLGGLASGQLAVWKLSDADLGHAVREKPRPTGVEEEKVSAIPTITHKIASNIDESHRKAVMAIEWLPATLEFERRGRAIERNPKDGPVKYFLTIAGDGQVLIWDFQSALDSINDVDFVWKPVHKIQLLRQDSGTEMGCGHILYCKDRDHLANFYASTEEGELIFGDWFPAKVDEDRKPDFWKKMFTISKTFRPMLSLERSPFFPDVLLGVTDWAFFLWSDRGQVQELLFQSSYTSTYFTRGCWSPTRPSVIFLGLANGSLDIWDFVDQSHKASLNETGASAAISSMAFLGHPDTLHNDQKLAVGDADGNLHVHNIPKNLVKPAGKEEENMRRFLDREEERVSYFNDRRRQLEDLRAQMEKDAQMAADKEKDDTAKAAPDEDRSDQQAEEFYKRVQEECLEQLANGFPNN